jgi:hypothetical protein
LSLGTFFALLDLNHVMFPFLVVGIVIWLSVSCRQDAASTPPHHTVAHYKAPGSPNPKQDRSLGFFYKNWEIPLHHSNISNILLHPDNQFYIHSTILAHSRQQHTTFIAVRHHVILCLL